MQANNTPDIRQIQLRLPAPTLDWIDREAAARGVSRNYVVRRAVEQLAEREQVAP